MLTIYVDADACPVKDEVYKVARRYGMHVAVVANAMLRVPTDALISVGGQMMVPLVEQNHVHFQRVKLGADDGAQVEVLDGLRGGEMVALNLGAEVSDGSPVRPQTAAAPAAR